MAGTYTLLFAGIFRSTLFESLSTGQKAQDPERKIGDRITAITAARTPYTENEDERLVF